MRDSWDGCQWMSTPPLRASRPLGMAWSIAGACALGWRRRLTRRGIRISSLKAFLATPCASAGRHGQTSASRPPKSRRRSAHAANHAIGGRYSPRRRRQRSGINSLSRHCQHQRLRPPVDLSLASPQPQRLPRQVERRPWPRRTSRTTTLSGPKTTRHGFGRLIRAFGNSVSFAKALLPEQWQQAARRGVRAAALGLPVLGLPPRRRRHRAHASRRRCRPSARVQGASTHSLRSIDG